MRKQLTFLGGLTAASILATGAFAERQPEIAELMSNVSFEIDTLNAVLAWAGDNGASTEEAAVQLIQNYSGTWAAWVNAAGDHPRPRDQGRA